jgi:hypothetical protein
VEKLGNQVHIPWSRRYFQTMQFSKTAVPHWQPELLNHSLKSMKVNFSIYLGQHNHQIWTSLNHSGQFWRLEWGTDSNLHHHEHILQEEWYKIPLETVLNLYKSIPRRIAAVLKIKMAQNHINKEICTVSVVFPLFCPTRVRFRVGGIVLDYPCPS